jgi:hypothetical protein
VAFSWTNPGNAVSDNATYAESPSMNGSATVNYTAYLQATNFGFSLPNSTINGIVLEVDKKASGDTAKGFIVDNSVQITFDNGVSFSATDLGDRTTHWGKTDAYATYGTSTELWGATPIYTEINSSDLGGGIVAQAGGAIPFVARIAYIDHMRMTVYYTVASGTIRLLASTGVGT